MDKEGKPEQQLLGSQFLKKTTRKRNASHHPRNVLKKGRFSVEFLHPGARKAPAKVSDKIDVLTTTYLLDLETSTFNDFQLSSFKQMCQAFASICHQGDEEKKTSYKFLVKNAEVYNRLMNIMLFRAHEVFHFHLKDALQKMKFSQGKRNVVDDFPHCNIKYKHSSSWSKIRPLIRSFIYSYICMIEKQTDEQIIICALKCLNKLVPFVLPLEAVSKKLLRCILQIWSNSKSQDIVLVSFLRIRQLARDSHHSFMDYIMKNMYLSYVRNSKFLNNDTIERVSTMRSCIINLYNMNLKSAYQCAFNYVRQLGVHVRNALKDKTLDSISQLFNCQFLNSIRLWVYMIVYSKRKELQPLCFPLVQIIISCVRLSSSSFYFPFRLHCVELLVILESSLDKIMVPVLPLLLDILDDGIINRHQTNNSNKKIPEWNLMLKVSPSQAETSIYKDRVMSKTLELIESHFSLYKGFLAFPEMTCRPILTLKKVQRTMKVPRWRQKVKALIFRLEKWNSVAKSMVKHFQYSPADVDKPFFFRIENEIMSPLKIQEVNEQVKLSDVVQQASGKTPNVFSEDAVGNEVASAVVALASKDNGKEDLVLDIHH